MADPSSFLLLLKSVPPTGTQDGRLCSGSVQDDSLDEGPTATGTILRDDRGTKIVVALFGDRSLYGDLVTSVLAVIAAFWAWT